MPIVTAPQDATAATGLSGTTSVISAGWHGQGELEGFPVFPSPERGNDQLQVPWRWDEGGRDAALYICPERRRSNVGACEGRLLPFMKGSDFSWIFIQLKENASIAEHT